MRVLSFSLALLAVCFVTATVLVQLPYVLMDVEEWFNNLSDIFQVFIFLVVMAVVAITSFFAMGGHKKRTAWIDW